jgi:hypothetical protein
LDMSDFTITSIHNLFLFNVKFIYI